jgi:phosphopantothenoylcysteine synthetase/decarboxylase
MDTFILVFLGFVGGYLMGKAVANWTSTIAFREILKDLGVNDADIQKLREKPTDDELDQLEVKIEQHQGQLYAFRLDNDQFLGQGASREELIESLKGKLNNVRVVVSEEHGAKLIQNA